MAHASAYTILPMPSWMTRSRDPMLPCVELRVHRAGATDQRSWHMPRRGPSRTPCRPAGRRGFARRGAECRGRSRRLASHARVSPTTTSRRAKTTALPTAPRRVAPTKSNIGQRAGRARRRMRLEHRETIGALDELHGRAPARVDFDRRTERPSRTMKSMPLTPTRPNSSATARASAHAASTSAASSPSPAAEDVAAVLVSRRPERCSPTSWRDTPSGTARPPAATKTTEPGGPSMNS